MVRYVDNTLIVGGIGDHHFGTMLCNTCDVGNFCPHSIGDVGRLDV